MTDCALDVYVYIIKTKYSLLLKVCSGDFTYIIPKFREVEKHLSSHMSDARACVLPRTSCCLSNNI